MEKKKHGKIIVGILVVLILQSLIYIYFGNQKVGFHIDEFYTYALSNGQERANDFIEDGRIYSGGSPFTEHYTTNKDNRFDYEMVWRNQAEDVHPPLYYFFIHTISSFLPEVFTKWIGLGVNIFFSLVVTILVYLVSKEVLKDKKAVFLSTVLFSVCPAVINSIMFLRMYILLNIWILAVVWLFLLYYDKKKLDKLFYVALLCITVLGTLTQYYFLIFLFFLCLYFGINLLIKKRWKDVVGYIFTLAAAGIISIAVFPAMLNQIFGDGYRGEQSFENLAKGGDFFERLDKYLEIFKNSFFGNKFGIFAFIIIILAVIAILMNIKDLKKKTVVCFFKGKVMMVIFTVLAYTILVIKISPFQTPRYIFCIYPFIIIGLTGILFRSMITIFRGRANTIVLTIVSLICLLSFYSSYKQGMSYLFLEEENIIDIAKQHKDEPMICIYDGKQWKLMGSYFELSYNESIIYISKKNLKKLENIDITGFDKMQVYVSDSLNQDKMVNKILSKNKYFKTSTLLYKVSYGSVYELE
ncbi:hypothetical protein [Robinsoniella peoriensis]|uniref:hypothetical protein n=1 Tax=Robinsoniella peoriensis TaxID=180332 RepID=UPI003750A0FC